MSGGDSIISSNSVLDNPGFRSSSIFYNSDYQKNKKYISGISLTSS